MKKENPLTALAQIGQLPKVGSGFAGYDISLGFSHRHALSIALDVLSELDKDESVYVLESLYEIFEQWKKEHGEPPKSQLITALLRPLESNQNKEKLPEKERISQIADLEPWQCCPYAETPVALFFRLIAEKYKPLDDTLRDWKPSKSKNNLGWITSYEYFLAVAIFISNNHDSVYQSGDCIEAAFRLVKVRTDIQKSLIKSQKLLIKRMTPAFEKEFKRKQGKKLKDKAQKDATKNAVREVFVRLGSQKEGAPKNFQETIAETVGIKQPQVSKILKELDIETKKLDQIIPSSNKNIPNSMKNKIV